MTAEELSSLLAGLSDDHPFVDFEHRFWTSTTCGDDSTRAVALSRSFSGCQPKSGHSEHVIYVRYVRGGNGYATGGW